MVGSLILLHSSVTHLTQRKILRAMFISKRLEMDAENKYTTIAFVWDIDKNQIWQAVLELECASFVVGYGFGDTKQEAIINGEKRFIKRTGNGLGVKPEFIAGFINSTQGLK